MRGHIEFVILLALILLFNQRSYSQYNAINYRAENQIDLQGSFQVQATQNNSVQKNELLPGIDISWEQDIPNMEIGNNSKPDSVDEFKNFGYYNELYKWYYSYDEQFHIDTIWRYYYNAKGEFNNIIEIKTYNTIGQLLKLVRRQPDYWALQVNGDSSIVDYYTEEYNYNGLNLVKSTKTSTDYSTKYVVNEYFTYDEEGRLKIDSLVNSGYTDKSSYSYNTSDKLEYIFYYVSDTLISGVTKFTYDLTDTTKLTTRYWVYYYNSAFNINPDTIAYWLGHSYYFEEYDHLKRRTSLEVENYNIYEGSTIDFKAEYQYTDKNNLLHISYYNWQGAIDSGIWKEATRIDNTYDENGNLLLYEKTFFDARSEKWETDNSKTYYYSSHPTRIDENFTKTKILGFYPNPVKNDITIKNSFNGISYYTIYNLNGFKIKSDRLENQSVNVSQFKRGIYILEIQNGQDLYLGKFVKE